MATNLSKADGDKWTYTNSSGSTITSGSVIAMTNGIAIALGDIANGSTGEVARSGRWTIAKDDSVAMAQGDALFWDSSNSELDKTEADQIYAGLCAEAAAKTDTTVDIQINAPYTKTVAS